MRLTLRSCISVCCSLVFALFLFAGCASQSVVGTQNFTSPVMVGPVANVKGEKINKHGKKIADFDIETQNVKSMTSGSYGNAARDYTKVEGSNKFDVELLKATTDPKNKVVVNKVRVGSSYLYLLFGFTDKIWAGIQGDIYE